LINGKGLMVYEKTDIFEMVMVRAGISDVFPFGVNGGRFDFALQNGGYAFAAASGASVFRPCSDGRSEKVQKLRRRFYWNNLCNCRGIYFQNRNFDGAG